MNSEGELGGGRSKSVRFRHYVPSTLQFSKAITDLNRAATFSPNDTQILFNRAIALFHSQDYVYVSAWRGCTSFVFMPPASS